MATRGIDDGPHAPKSRGSARHGASSARGERLLGTTSAVERSFGDGGATQRAQLSAPPIGGV
eukprot:scaffold133366_cov76-Phaeocystis_antarctica.AAC.2